MREWKRTARIIVRKIDNQDMMHGYCKDDTHTHTHTHTYTQTDTYIIYKERFDEGIERNKLFLDSHPPLDCGEPSTTLLSFERCRGEL